MSSRPYPTDSLGSTAALPVAGVTALQAVRRLGSVLGRRVPVTGASGGLGRFAQQLANLAGAEVVASAGSPERGEGLLDLGAAEVVIGPHARPAASCQLFLRSTGPNGPRT